METNTVILSAKFPCYSIPISPERAKRVHGFFMFMQSHFTFEQFKYLAACGEFLLRNGPGTEFLRARLLCIPVAPNPCDSFGHKPFSVTTIAADWKIELKFTDGPSDRDDDGNPKKFLKWSDFPGEVEIGFSFVED